MTFWILCYFANCCCFVLVLWVLNCVCHVVHLLLQWGVCIMQREQGKNERDEKTKMAYGTQILNILNSFWTDRFNSAGTFEKLENRNTYETYRNTKTPSNNQLFSLYSDKVYSCHVKMSLHGMDNFPLPPLTLTPNVSLSLSLSLCLSQCTHACIKDLPKQPSILHKTSHHPTFVIKRLNLSHGK